VKLSAQHGVMLREAVTGAEVLVRAGHLARWRAGVSVLSKAAPVRYHHLALAEHALLDVEGLGCESFYPGAIALGALGAADLARLLARLPGLAAVRAGADPAQCYGPRARPLVAGPRARAVIAGLGAGVPGQGRIASQPQIVRIESAVARSTVEAATRRATP
jgi:hypothetical protein